MRYFVTGGAGFIGSQLVDRLLSDGHFVTAYDNLSTGFPQFLDGARSFDSFTFVKGDLLDKQFLRAVMAGHDFVFHLAANADVRHGIEHPTKDLEQNTVATSNVLEAMHSHGITKIAFSSTGSVYGESAVFPTPEDAPFPVQTSLYGASKLACEGLIEAYCEGFGFQAWIFRFVSILGERYSHGHVFDFYRQLLAHPSELRILGNGKQRKSYLYAHDCIDGILLGIEAGAERVNIFNLGTDEYCSVEDSVDWICSYLNLVPRRIHAGGERGWVGDSPFIFLDCTRIRALGWTPRLSIREGVIRTLEYLRANPKILESRA